MTDVTRATVGEIGARDPGIEHPAMMPRSLPEQLISRFTRPGDAVLDFCAGSGQTMLAAVALERRAIWIEKEPAYVHLARRRLMAMIATRT